MLFSGVGIANGRAHTNASPLLLMIYLRRMAQKGCWSEARQTRAASNFSKLSRNTSRNYGRRSRRYYLYSHPSRYTVTYHLSLQMCGGGERASTSIVEPEALNIEIVNAGTPRSKLLRQSDVGMGKILENRLLTKPGTPEKRHIGKFPSPLPVD